MPVYDLIGANLPRVDAFPKAKGEAIYIEDMQLPGMLYGGVLRSPYSHAKILNIDTSRAKTLPGVKTVITANDIPKVLLGMLPTVSDQYAMAVGQVRHYLEAIYDAVGVRMQQLPITPDKIKKALEEKKEK